MVSEGNLLIDVGEESCLLFAPRVTGPELVDGVSSFEQDDDEGDNGDTSRKTEKQKNIL